MDIHGRCHCGNVTYTLATGRAWSDVVLRICGCSFCLRHRPRCWSDPAGSLTVTIAEPAAVNRYRFGQGTADFVICGRCGVFCFASAAFGDHERAVVNMNLADGVPSLPERPLEALDETGEQRTGRRRANWTPVR